MSRGWRFSPYDLRGFKLVDGKIVTTYPKADDLGPQRNPLDDMPVEDDPPPRDDEPEAA